MSAMSDLHATICQEIDACATAAALLAYIKHLAARGLTTREFTQRIRNRAFLLAFNNYYRAEAKDAP